MRRSCVEAILYLLLPLTSPSDCILNTMFACSVEGYRGDIDGCVFDPSSSLFLSRHLNVAYEQSSSRSQAGQEIVICRQPVHVDQRTRIGHMSMNLFERARSACVSGLKCALPSIVQDRIPYLWMNMVLTSTLKKVPEQKVLCSVRSR